jgi:hypothetical protein
MSFCRIEFVIRKHRFLYGVLWNTVYIEHAVNTLRQQGHRIPDELLPHIAPPLCEHINLTGDNAWKPRAVSANVDLRSLRLAPQYLEAA